MAADTELWWTLHGGRLYTKKERHNLAVGLRRTTKVELNESGGRQMRKDSDWLQIQNCGRLDTVVGSRGRKNDTSWRWDSGRQRKWILMRVVGVNNESGF